MGFKCLTCCELDFLAGGILCVALDLILRCKFSQNLPTNDSLQKDQVKLQVPENCILPRFFKDFAPAAAFFRTARPEGVRHSKFQSVTLYIYIYIYIYVCIMLSVENSMVTNGPLPVSQCTQHLQ